jgi:hypothetical protein
MPEDIMGEITKQMQLLAKRALDGFGLELTIDQINYFINILFCFWNGMKKLILPPLLIRKILLSNTFLILSFCSMDQSLLQNSEDQSR